jgi:hypothetical protein
MIECICRLCKAFVGYEREKYARLDELKDIISIVEKPFCDNDHLGLVEKSSCGKRSFCDNSHHVNKAIL